LEAISTDCVNFLQTLDRKHLRSSIAVSQTSIRQNSTSKQRHLRTKLWQAWVEDEFSSTEVIEQTPRARAALFGGGKFSTTESKPHERESYSLQNTVAVFIMFVMQSSKEAL